MSRLRREHLLERSDGALHGVEELGQIHHVHRAPLRLEDEAVERLADQVKLFLELGEGTRLELLGFADLVLHEVHAELEREVVQRQRQGVRYKGGRLHRHICRP